MQSSCQEDTTLGRHSKSGTVSPVSRQAELVAQLEAPETYEKSGLAMHINRELTDVQQRLAELNPGWEQAATRLEALDSE